MKSKVIPLFLIAIFLFSVSFISAVSIITPAASSTASGTYEINVTSTGLANIDNCTIYGKSTSTANSSWSSLIVLQNESTDASFVNGSYDTTGLEDAADYIFNATCYNTTGDTAEDTNIGIIIGNTVPIAPSSLSPTSDSDGDADFSATVTGSRTTACTLYFTNSNPGESSYSMTHSGDTCTVSLTSMPELTYEYYIQASDGTDTTNSGMEYIEVGTSTGGGTSEDYSVTIPGVEEPIPMWLIIGGIILLIFLIVKFKK